MQTHVLFTRPNLSEDGTYSVRESLDNKKYDPVIEVQITGGESEHIEVRTEQSMYRVKNGPFFLGGTQYVCKAGTFYDKKQAIAATVSLLKGE